jgi:hypothetical protein
MNDVASFLERVRRSSIPPKLAFGFLPVLLLLALITNLTQVSAQQRPPELSSPTNTDRFVEIVPALEFFGLSERFADYDLQIATDSMFTATLQNLRPYVTQNRRFTGEFTFSVAFPESPLTPQTRYWWRVRFRSNGLSSPVWSFTTAVATAAPNAPILRSPANRDTATERIPRLEYFTVTNAVRFFLQYSTDSTFRTYKGVTSSFSTSIDLKDVPDTLLPQTRYWWRVRAFSRGAIGPWSDAFSFRTIRFIDPDATCEGLTVITDTAGILCDGSATRYGNGLNCSWLIQPAGARQVSLTFNRFATESGFDVVTIHDGTTASAPVIGSFSGNTIPPVVRSSGGAMFVRFVTDGSTLGTGWCANFSTVRNTGELRYSASGRVTYRNDGLREVTLRAVNTQSPTQTLTTTTDNSGNFAFSSLVAGTYTLTPNREDYTFTPESRTVAISNANVTQQNFTAEDGFTVSGSVTWAGFPISGVRVRVTSATTSAVLNDTTDMFGQYTFKNLRNGTYTITVSSNEYSFSPNTQTVMTTSSFVLVPAFSGRTPYTISGRITFSGVGLAGVLLNPGGIGGEEATTDSTGRYVMRNVGNRQQYTLVPAATDYTFSPFFRQVTVQGASVADQDFTAARTGGAFSYSVSGRITQQNGAGLANVSVNAQVFNVAFSTVLTDSAGRYTIPNLPNNREYIILPVLAGFAFTPATRTVTLTNQNLSGQDFIAAPGGSTMAQSGSVNLVLGADSAAAGSDVTLTLSVGSIRNAAASLIATVTGNVLLNATLLVPVETTPQGAVRQTASALSTPTNPRFERSIPLSIALTQQPRDGDVIARLRFRATLGDAEETALRLDDVRLLGERGTVLPLSLTTSNGSFRLRGVRRGDRQRLIGTTGVLAVLHRVAPNPVAENAILQYDILSATAVTISIHDIFGRVIHSVPLGEMQIGSYSTEWSMANLPPGVYFCRLQTTTETLTQRMEVLR